MSDYTPTTDEIETAFVEFASELETESPGEYKYAPEFAHWRGALNGFRRWLKRHNREVAAKAWDEGFSAQGEASFDRDGKAIMFRPNPYTDKAGDSDE